MIFGAPWTASEDLLLREMARRKYRNPDISARLGRTPLAVTARARKLRISLDPHKFERPERNPDMSTWTEADRLAAFADVPQELAELVVSVCKTSGYGLKSLRQITRNKSLIQCSWEIARQAKAMGYSYPVIGRALNRDHTSVLHAVRTMEAA